VKKFFIALNAFKTLTALTALGTIASAAHAQSSLTLYGLIDAGLTYTNNQGGSHDASIEHEGACCGNREQQRGFDARVHESLRPWCRWWSRDARDWKAWLALPVTSRRLRRW
jgi:hypothetical protein